ncbi:MAG: translation initiation factor Sui1 [Burkholderiaceae bacterium]|nr:translation initiation factor Sui1 [Burkholderiales bacterium]MCZ8337234.1 translation initiation factor Sui1 [Burkholderiaceae bacterium]
MKGGRGGLVYSTEHGRICPTCRRPVAACTCRGAAASMPASSDGLVRVSRETGGRGGKTVTVVRGVPLAADALAALAKSLKAACGTGGTAKDGAIELQGDHRDAVIARLERDGWRVKRAGG